MAFLIQDETLLPGALVLVARAQFTTQNTHLRALSLHYIICIISAVELDRFTIDPYPDNKKKFYIPRQG